MGPETYQDHNLGLSISHDVIAYVTIRLTMSFPIGGPLEASLYLQPCLGYLAAKNVNK